MNLAALSIKRPTFILALVITMLVVGLISFVHLGMDLTPDITFPVVAVVTPYRGAGPQEIETLVTKPLEEEISGISGIKHLSSINQDGLSTIVVEFDLGTDIKNNEQRVRDKVSSARSKLPKEIDEPVLRRFDPADTPILRLALSADLPPAGLYAVAKDLVKTRLEQINNVALVQIVGGTQREIQVNLDRHQLKEHELSLTAVSQRAAANSQNVPVGNVSRGDQEILFRTLGEYRSLDQIRKTAVSFFGSDHPVSVGDIGTVADGTEDVKSYGYFNGTPTVYIDIYRQSGANVVQVVDNLMRATTELNKAFKTKSGNPRLAMVQDQARVIRWNVEDVRNAIAEGILLTVIVVYFFLGSFRSTLITSVALPNSLIGAFILMYLLGFTINMISLLALSLCVGLLIDDAIVVRENIWRHMGLGQDPKKAAISGTNEVTLAVIATTITIISVFGPIGFLGGIVGQFFRQLGWTVVFAMAVSLFDAMTMAPLLSAYLATGQKREPRGLKKFFDACCSPLTNSAKAFERFQTWLTQFYERVIRFCLGHRLLVVSLALLFFFGSFFLLHRLPVTFFPSQDIGYFQVTLEAPPGTSLEGMRSTALQVQQVLRRHPEIEKIGALVGNSDGEANVASFYVELVNYRKRKFTTSDLKEILRNELKPFAAVRPMVGDVSNFGGNQAPFTMYLIGEDLDKLSAAAEQAKAAFARIPGLVDLDTDYRPGKPEYQIAFDSARMQTLGINGVTAGAELRGMVDGVVPAQYRIGDKEYDIRVRVKPEQRDLREGLDQFFVPNMNNNLIRLSDVAAARQTSGPLKIRRYDRQRYVMVYGQLGKNGALGNIQATADQIMKNLRLPDGVTYRFVGQAESLQELFTNMVIAMMLSVLLIYLVLASLYESLVMPILIMTALPLGFVGAFAALYLFGQTLNMFSMIALVLLMGLVVKNSILMVDYTIHLIRRGTPRREAIIQAGKIRLRPILMTTIAVIAGTLPIALALSEVSRFRQSMGIAIIGGLVSSTLLTLLVIPSAFEWFDDARQWLRRLFHRPPLREIDLIESGEEKLPELAAAGSPAGPVPKPSRPGRGTRQA